MKILIADWNSFGREDIKEAIKACGHSLAVFSFDKNSDRSDPKVAEQVRKEIRKHTPDRVFSFNYFPQIAVACKEESVQYISWIYDSPYVQVYSYTIAFPTNTIYLFDREWVFDFNKNRIENVFYLPMAANPERLGKLINHAGISGKYDSDVCFIGSLYRGSHDFWSRMEPGLDDYTRGYLEALIRAQMDIYGVNFIEESLNERVISGMKAALPMDTFPDGVESIEYLYGQYVIDREITSRERISLLSAVAKKLPLTVYTGSDTAIPGAKMKKPIDHYTESPVAMNRAKINLNITLRSIRSGMPLRVFEIMGSGGFLMTNFQGDFGEFFTPGEDFEYFEDREDLVERCSYYLEHEDERREIAESALKKIKARHTFEHRVREMFS
ncbi:MAG: glycosyltransferase [Lachnospiraceae bacterium]|nr:glycosyltransferase [Lachnospiraceae bacterium]